MIQLTLTTAANSGAIAIVQLRGDAVTDLLRCLTGITHWPTGRVKFANLGGIDEGCAVCLGGGLEGHAQLMPHGGPRVVKKLIDDLIHRGCQWTHGWPPSQLYPEAGSELEADVLATIATTASPAAIDRLLAQVHLWPRAVEGTFDRKTIQADSNALDRLIDPPTVVVVGAPNVGKSTLTNRLSGRSVSLVADLPGTTRDWVGGLVQMVPGSDCGHSVNQAAVAVKWLDTPGLRSTADPIERKAIAVARRVVNEAEVLVAMRDPQADWPKAAELPRQPDLWLINKIDEGRSAGIGLQPTDPLAISARTGRGLEQMQQRILQKLGLANGKTTTLWAFSPTLRGVVESGDLDRLRAYVAER